MCVKNIDKMSQDIDVLIAHSEHSVTEVLLDILVEEYKIAIAHTEEETMRFFDMGKKHPAVTLLPYDGFMPETTTRWPISTRTSDLIRKVLSIFPIGGSTPYDETIPKAGIEPLVRNITATNRLCQIVLLDQDKDYSKSQHAHDAMDAWYLAIGANPKKIDRREVKRKVDDAYIRYMKGSGINDESRIGLHDLNNALCGITGYAGLLADGGIHEADAEENVKMILTSSGDVEEIVRRLQKTIVRDGSTETRYPSIIQEVCNEEDATEKTEFRIVYVDDAEVQRNLFRKSLTQLSNLNPHTTGVFGHDPYRVTYELHIYSNPKDAISEIPSLGDIDLVVTDRQMDPIDGFRFLDELTTTDGQTATIKPRFSNVKKLAMYSAGASAADIARANMYGEFVSKGIMLESIEPAIYAIIQGNYRKLTTKQP